MKRAWSLFVLGMTQLGFVSAVHAFKPELHFKYTYRASQALASCGGNAVDPWLIGKVAIGTDKEDTTEPLNRIANWHYASNERLPETPVLLAPLPIVGYATMAHVFATRSAELFDAITQGDCRAAEIHERAGHVLHFLQDMRVPAHVIPVHHGSVFGEDGFDEHDFNFAVSDAGDVCQRLDEKAKGLLVLAAPGKHDQFLAALEDIRKVAGSETNAMIGERVGATGCTAREIFWCDPAVGEECGTSPMKGFGKYRRFPRGMRNAGKVVAFGESQVACNGKLVNVEPEDYQAYFRHSYQRMMRDSALMLRLAQLASEKCSASGY